MSLWLNARTAPYEAVRRSRLVGVLPVRDEKRVSVSSKVPRPASAGARGPVIVMTVAPAAPGLRVHGDEAVHAVDSLNGLAPPSPREDHQEKALVPLLLSVT